jgi:thioredoxin reductase (NADPH)
MNTDELPSEIYDVVIIGSGPAGYTAGIYCSRAMLKTLLVSGKLSGGQLMTTSDVENFPGYPNSVSGPELMKDMRKQAERFGTKIISGFVKNISKVNDNKHHNFVLYLNDDKTLLTKSIIVATGAEAQWLNLPNENKLRSRGISTCATCDGSFFQNEHLVVLGGGDSAMEEAIFLTRYASSVTIIHRRNEFRASKIMLSRARKNPKINWITNAIATKWVRNINGELSGVEISINGELQTVECTGAFIAIGHKPATEFIHNLVEVDSHGYIVLHENTMTSVPGIFACGDVTDRRYRQAITASGQGCQSAMDVEKWLAENE